MQISNRQLPRSVSRADIPPPSSVRDEKRNVRKGGTEFLSEQVMISFRIQNHFTVLGSHNLLPWDFSVDIVGCA